MIKVNDIVVEIETAKSLVELPSPYAGTVQELLVPEGETVAVGTPIITVGDGRGRTAAPAPADRRPAPSTESDPYLGLAEKAGAAGPRSTCRTPRRPAAARTRRWSATGRAPRPPQRRPRRGGAEPGQRRRRRRPAAAPGRVQPGRRAEAADVGRRPTETAGAGRPPARRTSRRARRPTCGCWRSRRCASWPRTSASTCARSPRPARAAPSPATTSSGARRPTRASVTAQSARRPSDGGSTGRRRPREPVKGVRKMMAQAMVASAFTAPHVTEWVTVDVTRTMKLVERLKAHRDFRDVKVSPLLVVAKAVCLAMRRTPELNATWDEAAQEIVLKHYVNLGIAAATPRGLVVPNIKDADALSLPELAPALNDAHAYGARGPDPARGDERRHVHDHQRRRLRRRRRHADHQPRASRRSSASARSGRSRGCRGRQDQGPRRSPRWRCPSTTGSSTASRARGSWPTWPPCSRTRARRCSSSRVGDGTARRAHRRLR